MKKKTLDAAAVIAAILTFPATYQTRDGRTFKGERVSAVPKTLIDNGWRNVSGLDARDFARLGLDVVQAQYVQGVRPTGKFCDVVVARYLDPREDLIRQTIKSECLLRAPISIEAHRFLTDEGAATLVDQGDADFDDGDPENGPGYGGHPEYDRYYADEQDLAIDWRGVYVADVEPEPPADFFA